MTNRPYHHGDLREALLSEGLVVIQEAGAAGLRVRDLARRVGVSHAAAYRHFGSRQALLNAIAVGGFGALTTALIVSGEGLSEPAERVSSRAHAYLSYALDNPQRYRLMFGNSQAALEDGELAASASACFDLLVEDARALGAEDPHRAATMAWATLHGFAHLALDGLIVPGMAQDLVKDAVARVLGITSGR